MKNGQAEPPVNRQISQRDPRWRTKPLENFCNVEYGTRVVQKRDGGKGFPVYGGGGATFEMDRFNREDRIVVARFGMSKECTRFVVGKFFLNDSGLTVSPKDGLMLQRFLDYQMLALNDDIFALGKGAAQKNLDVPAFRILPLHAPESLAEQQRIIDLLDEAFKGLDTAKVHAEKNLQNARAIFESHLQSVFTRCGQSWVEKPLETVSSILNGYSFKSTDFSATEETKCIKITNVGVREFVTNSDGYLPNSFAAKYQKVSVMEGSIVIALTRTIISDGLKVAVVPKEYGGALLNQRVAAITSNEQLINSSFLFAYLSTQLVMDYVKERVNTLMQPNLSITDLRLMPIPLPPRNEQDEITKQLDLLREETQRLEDLYQCKLDALEALKKSLLHQAFTGQL